MTTTPPATNPSITPPPSGVGTIAAMPSALSAAVPSTSFDQAAASGQFMPYASFGTPGQPPGQPNPYDSGLPSSSLDRLQSGQNDGMTGALTPAQSQPFGSQQTYVTVPVDKVMVSPSQLGSVEPQMGAPAGVRYAQPRGRASATTPSTASPQRRYGGQTPMASMPPYSPTTPAAQAVQ